MWSRVAKWGINFLAGEVARIWVWPILPPIGIGLIGWIQGVPWFYLFVGSGVLFAAISTGLLRFSEWKYRTIVQDKLVFNRVRVAKELADDGSVKSLRLGFQLNSSAMFPVQCRVSELATQFMSLFPPKKRYEEDSFIVPPQGFGWFDDHTIQVPNPPIDQSVEGQIEFRLDYGKIGHLHQSLHMRKKVFLRFDKRGDITVCEWIDAKISP